MKLTAAIFTFILYFSNSFADTTEVQKWFPSAKVGLGVSQITFENWVQGGDNSIAWTLGFFGGLNYKHEGWTWRNNLKLAYGRTKLGTESYRTNDNELFFESVVSRNVGWAVDPYFSNTVRSSLSQGFNYKVTPAVKIADFFDPGYVTQSLGFTYDKTEGVKTRLGVAFQEVFANDFAAQYTDDPNTTELEKFKFETGIESVSDAEFMLDTNVGFKSSLRLFSRFESLDVWDIRWENILVAKVSNYISVNLNILVLYEKFQSPKTQFKEALLLGFTYTLL